MSDEHIQRLTELAQRVWPGQHAKVSWDPFYDVVKVVNDRGTFLFEMQNPRALDALEAALLVLAEDVLSCTALANALDRCAAELRERARRT